MGLRLRAPRSMRVLSVVLMVWERAEKSGPKRPLSLRKGNNIYEQGRNPHLKLGFDA